MFSLLFQLVLGWLVAAGCYRLAKAHQPWTRLAGWGLGLAFGWHYLGGLTWDARLLFWGHLTSLFSILVHGGLLAATGLALFKGAKEAQGKLIEAPSRGRLLPRR